ncbi:hypothetical protein AAMO2058_000692400 [Amorphochlora amoebiformis]
MRWLARVGLGLFLVLFFGNLLEMVRRLELHEAVPFMRARYQGEPEKEAPRDPQVQAVYSLLARLFPGRGNEFVLARKRCGSGGSGCFSVRAMEGVVYIEGDGGVSLAAGVGYYLQNYAFCSFSWLAENLNLPSPLPNALLTTKKRYMKETYYMNVCTHSYTMAFWDWPRWEREVDWMALRGITMPLILSGREVVFQALMIELNVPKEKLQKNFFTGPAFLAWHRMGNLRRWGGGLTDAWLETQKELTIKILRRARSFGMRPALPSFTGHVPDELRQTQAGSNAKIGRASSWFGFHSPNSELSFVEPSDPLYRTLGTRFLQIQEQIFGTDHIYAGDQFNEMNPSERTVEYVRKASENHYAALKDADPDAIWVMQGWLFVHARDFWSTDLIRAYLGGVARDRIIVLDLISEAAPAYHQTNFYEGRGFIWSILHNFGGDQGLGGQAQRLMTSPYEAGSRGNLVGVGLTMEGSEQNAIVYDLLLSHAYEPKPRNLNTWLTTWIRGRYGGACDPTENAWKLLIDSVYKTPTALWGQTKSIISKRPSLNRESVITKGFQQTSIEYDPKTLVRSLGLLLTATNGDQITLESAPNEACKRVSLGGNSEYRLDLVEVSRQALSNTLLNSYEDMLTAYSEKRVKEFRVASERFREAAIRMDSILQTNKNFDLSTWIQRARSLASTPQERRLYEFNARNLVTLWGPSGQISDYASRQWSGLIRTYYLVRWEMFISRLNASLHNPMLPFDESRLHEDIRAFELSWENREEDSKLQENNRDQGDIVGLASDAYRFCRLSITN